jgi:hypothetical protein
MIIEKSVKGNWNIAWYSVLIFRIPRIWLFAQHGLVVEKLTIVDTRWYFTSNDRNVSG